MEADDYFAIQNVLFSYPFALDAGDFDAVGELLGDALIHSGGAVMADRDAKAVAEVFRSWVLTYADGTPRTRHMLSNVMIVPEGEGRARVSSYVMVFQQAPDGPLEPVIGGDYLDRLEKRDGRWRIVERTMGNDIVGDLSRHGRDLGTIRPTRANGSRPLQG
ncbi:3-phenylpropionate/cinnamic acid dioxygenase, small subunit [Sphingomonas laterariae]|uniref:3-phenylpropionate/cinnamic acid dioxygenase, small subunit n=1 Tax=Edaphosphingomonas laterariae TaxID=861865 RepID=A0A239J522_9SPHN|nr:nuclear transport factor 2 family protein [Sphingomonas laterariae]SNT01116.1 3-phenylpropionate/cinnamic acid dioxygenase, small subunit [Sphingomonas laterariae]